VQLYSSEYEDWRSSGPRYRGRPEKPLNIRPIAMGTGTFTRIKIVKPSFAPSLVPAFISTHPPR